ncbi:MAG: glycosyltransferase [Pseudomonadota bacterium]
MKTVILTAFHFPPLVGTSGIQRTLRFVQHLPAFGWRPVVLTVRRGIHKVVDLSTEQSFPETCEVIRAGCLDTARHLSLGGRYLSSMALPDRWASWQWFARLQHGALREMQAQVVWSTYPIATAHHVGYGLARALDLPWVADFRDPMAQDGYPSDPRQHRAFLQTERLAVEHAKKLVFVAPSALDTYRKRYAQAPADRFELIPNGYDEASFEGLSATPPPVREDRPLVLLHSGVIYQQERNPDCLFQALRTLQEQGEVSPDQLQLRFRATANDDFVRECAARHGVEAFIEIASRVSYREALQEMLEVDGLLVLQSATCNEQIPAKLYEYLRTGRPIMALADPAGDTGGLLRSLDLPWVTPLESTEGITTLLRQALGELRAGQARGPARSAVECYSRRALTGQLAALLDGVSEGSR